MIAFRGENKKADQLFDYFKDEKNGFNGNNILELVDNMHNVSRIYREIELGNYDVFLDDHNMYVLFKLLGIKQFHPLLMIFYNSDKAKKALVLDCITRLGAAVLFSYTQTNYIEKILPTMIRSYWETKSKDESAAFNNLIKEIEDRIKEVSSTMRATLTTRNFIGKNGEVHSKALMLLKFVELYFNSNTKICSVPKGKKITVEHILSRNINEVSNSELGFLDDKERKDYIHRLGNLTLLYNTDNASVGNSIYADKISTYKVSDFILTSTLVTPVVTTVKNGKDTTLYKYINFFEKKYSVDNDNWTKELIAQRSADLAMLLECIVKNDYSMCQLNQ